MIREFIEQATSGRSVMLTGEHRFSGGMRNRIILEAKRFLHYTDKSAKEIAYELGFESPSHFNRLFKQYTGKSPLAFKS